MMYLCVCVLVVNSGKTNKGSLSSFRKFTISSQTSTIFDGTELTVKNWELSKKMISNITDKNSLEFGRNHEFSLTWQSPIEKRENACKTEERDCF